MVILGQTKKALRPIKEGREVHFSSVQTAVLAIQDSPTQPNNIMFARYLLFFTALPALVAATAVPRNGGGNQCSNGPVQCCGQVGSVSHWINFSE
jgi:hypothetical protein